jgi:hypothetical protein
MDASTLATPAPAAPAVREDASNTLTLLRRFFPFYCVLTAVVTFGYARYDAYQLDGDAVNYMDLGDLLRAHQWAGIVNGYWHPMYPAFLSLGHMLFHATLANELRAYYMVNFGIFLLEMAAMICFTDSILRLRTTLQPADTSARYLLDRYALRYLGLALLVIASQRELSLGRVRPDALLQAFLLFALAALLTHLASARLRYAGLMGLALGCAYLTKSFAFVFAFLCILMLAVFRWLWMKHSPARVIPAVLVAFFCFGIVAGPYVAALSHQKGRLNFGDSGSLNYAWIVGGTEKMHLEPYMTSKFGSAEVHLKHPDRELLHSPPIFSYAQLPYGTYPDWFDATYWNDQIKPHFKLRDDIPRAARNGVLVVRYLFNHLEALILLWLVLLLGARLTLPVNPRSPVPNAFWLAPLVLGLLAWGIYGIVNTEERYVTFAYFSIILTLFATLRLPDSIRVPNLRSIASVLIVFLAVLATGESLRTVFEDRRNLSGLHSPGGWYSSTQFQAADALHALGVQPGDSVACVGWVACLNDQYWARRAGVRILTEIYAPDVPAYPFVATMPNRDQAIATVRAQGDKVLVADFGTFRVSDSDPIFRDWHQLGDTTFYALPLNLPVSH